MSEPPIVKTLRIVQRVAIVVAAAAMVLGLFMLGHTERFSTTATVIVAVVSGVSAVVAGILQWVGLPTKDPNAPPRRKRT